MARDGNGTNGNDIYRLRDVQVIGDEACSRCQKKACCAEADGLDVKAFLCAECCQCDKCLACSKMKRPT